MLLNSRNFTSRSFKTMLWIFLMFSVVTASFGRPLRSASFVSLRPHLKSANQRLIVVSDGAESP
uniref:Uncharacterized protein n=1 Tax=Lepeophtheirus salmonis TaxID=72036 RepID=A0A0K2URW1_LEPSM